MRLTVASVSQPVTNSAGPIPLPDCTNQFTTAYLWYIGYTPRQTWPAVVESTYYFYTSLLSNITVTVTNALWPAQGIWQAPSVMPGHAYDPTNNIGSYARLVSGTPSPGNTNLLTLTDFLSNTRLTPYPATADGILRGWGFGNNVRMLLDSSITNGMPHR